MQHHRKPPMPLGHTLSASGTPPSSTEFGEGTVFVLGAGFTKSFLPNAPTLVDDFHAKELLKAYQPSEFDKLKFKTVRTILELEMNHPDHDLGKINLERLMTRLAGGMPYDVGRTGAEKELQVLLHDLKQAFLRRLRAAREADWTSAGELQLFAGHCVKNRVNCITFNYDDVLDEALWGYRKVHMTTGAWSPDWGYGFPCRMSEVHISSLSLPEPVELRSGRRDLGDELSTVHRPPETSPMYLLKLHGSLNWRIALGHAKPYAVDALTHHEEWFQDYAGAKIPLQVIEPVLESDPFFVPPILTKSDLVEQPVLRLIWTLALKRLRKAKRVVFIGYSLPLTDIAAGFLFREGLRQLDHAQSLTVVDFAANDEERAHKLPQLLAAYKNVFPALNESQIQFCGAADWIRDNLTQWVYNSQGKPIAYRALQYLISAKGNLVGRITPYSNPTREEVDWGTYRGEIVEGNRFLFKEGTYPDQSEPGPHDALPSVPQIPNDIGVITLPDGYRDVDCDATL